MKFNRLIKKQLFPILQKEGFEILEESKNVVSFASSFIEINLVYNEYENSNYISIGKLGETLYPLNDNVIKNIFNSELHINQVTCEVFIKNLTLIFQQKEGIEILKGNIKDLIKFIEKGINDYHSELFKKQILETALQAWEVKNYKSFINNIDSLGFEKIPKSYQLKYKIAKQKI